MLMYSSSTVVQNIRTFCQIQPAPQRTSAAFFYCSFTDSQKQKTFNLICSFLLQLAQELSEIPTRLLHLYIEYKHMQSSINILQMTLRSVLKELGQTFLVIDALDECIDETRKEVLDLRHEIS